MPAVDPFAFAELTDALARGRLAPAEIAAVPPRELDALFELAAQCLDVGRDREAADLLGGLVTLFPFSARYWRGYAIALHRRLHLARARAAYDAALALEPGHPLCRCYRAEIWLYLGQAELARAELSTLVASSDRRAAERARELLARLDALASWRPPAEEGAPDPAGPPDPERLALGDRRELPLADSRFSETDEPIREETTQTARIFIAPAAPLPAERSITETAVVRRRADAAPEVTRSRTVTGTDTALLPGAAHAPAPTPRPAEAADNADVTHTAVVLRREGVCLIPETTDLVTARINRARNRPPPTEE